MEYLFTFTKEILIHGKTSFFVQCKLELTLRNVTNTQLTIQNNHIVETRLCFNGDHNRDKLFIDSQNNDDIKKKRYYLCIFI